VQISADRLARSRWRRSRRAAHQSLTKSAVRDYHNVLRKEAILLAVGLLADPGASEKHFKRTAASATMSIVYDYPTLETEHEKTVKEIFAFIDCISEAAAPGAYLVELFPWMLHIPERSVRASVVVFLSQWHIPISDLLDGSMKEPDISRDSIPYSSHFLIVFGPTW
jgi:hypothetical protein